MVAVPVGLMFSWFHAPNFGLLYLLTEWPTGTGIAVLADEDYVPYGIIVAGLWPQITYCMILYLTGLDNVAPDQVVAARLRGAKGSSRVLSFYMYEKALSEYGYPMGYGAAITVVLFAIMMVFISGFIWKMRPTIAALSVLSTSASNQPVTAGLYSLNGQWIAACIWFRRARSSPPCCPSSCSS